MEHFTHFITRHLPGSLSKGASRIPRAFLSALRKDHYQWILGVILVVVSFSLATWVIYEVQGEAIKKWRSEQTPSVPVLTGFLQANGFHRVSDLDLKQKTQRKLPSSVDQNSSIWLEKSLFWVLIYHPDEPSFPLIFSKISINHLEQLPSKSNLLPQSWAYLGMGWRGFDKLVAEIKRSPGVPRTREKRRISNVYRDPREIQY